MTETTLVVVGADGKVRPGFALRAGDFIERTHYEHDRRTLTAHIAPKPLTLRVRFRRWREGRRR